MYYHLKQRLLVKRRVEGNYILYNIYIYFFIYLFIFNRCWIFAAQNVLRLPQIQKLNQPKTFELSQNYVFFWDKQERCNYFLESILHTIDKEKPDSRLWSHLLTTPIMDGGQWNMFISIVNKYGLVPKTVYPDNFNACNTSTINWILNNRLRHTVSEFYKEYNENKRTIDELRSKKDSTMQDIYCTLCCLLGEPITTFSWYPYTERSTINYDTKLSLPKDGIYTPYTFAKQVVFDFGFGNNNINILNTEEAKTAETTVYRDDQNSITTDDTNTIEISKNASKKENKVVKPQKILITNPSTWISFVNDPRHEYNILLTVQYLGSIWEPIDKSKTPSCVRYINIQSSKLIKLVTMMIEQYRQPVWFGCDSGKFTCRKYNIWDPKLMNFNRTLGNGMVEVNTFTKKDRLIFNESCMTHAMVFTGVHIENGVPVRFRVENSWGDSGTNSGYYSMSYV